MPTTTPQASNELTLTYKYLLSFSTFSAVFFCWLYVTKPTTVTATQPELEDSAVTVESSTSQVEEKAQSSFASLNSASLPGDAPKEQLVQENATAKNSKVPLPQSDSTQGLVGFEETNDRVQHVLTAQTNTSSERVIIEVPVIYQTRGLRFGPEQAKEAQRVLRALKIYQSQIKKLHQDGKNIQTAWNALLMSAQPVEALRADSPSLPQNVGSHPSMLSENSSSTIKVSK